MNLHRISNRVVPVAAAGLSIFLATPSLGACNNPKKWVDTPDASVKVFIGYKQEQPPGFGSPNVGQSSADYLYPNALRDVND